MELMSFENLFDLSQDDETNKAREKWKQEWAAKTAGLSEKEILRLQQQELVDLSNSTEGDLGFVDCKICLNKGYIEYLDENDYVVSKNCECMKQRKTLHLIEISGLSESLKEFTFDKFKTPNKWQEWLKKRCIEFVNQDEKKWLMIAGNTGSGKTHLCTAVMGEFLKRSLYCLYMPFTQRSAELKQQQYRDVEKYHEMLESLQKCDVLYIDDLFYSEPTKADIEIAFNILDYRVKANKTTLISTERSFKELFEIRESTFSRIYHLCGKFKTDIPKKQEYNYRLKGGG